MKQKRTAVVFLWFSVERFKITVTFSIYICLCVRTWRQLHPAQTTSHGDGMTNMNLQGSRLKLVWYFVFFVFFLTHLRWDGEWICCSLFPIPGENHYRTGPLEKIPSMSWILGGAQKRLSRRKTNHWGASTTLVRIAKRGVRLDGQQGCQPSQMLTFPL